MTAIGRAEVKEVLPMRLAVGAIRGAAEIPQVIGASAIRVGLLATPMLASDELTWQRFTNGTASEAQIEKIATAVNTYHTNFNIGARFDPTRPEGTDALQRLQGEPVLISKETVGQVARIAAYIASRSMTAFAASALRHEVPFDQPNLGRRYIASRGSLFTVPLFVNPAHRPKVAALQELWRLSDELLDTPNVRAEATIYKQAIAKVYGDQDASDAIRHAEERRMRVRLSEVLGSQTTQRAIFETTGYALPDDAVQDFIDSTSLYYSQKA